MCWRRVTSCSMGRTRPCLPTIGSAVRTSGSPTRSTHNHMETTRMTTPSSIGRRTAIKMGLAGAAAALAPRRARAQNPREAKNAAQRLVAQEPDVVGGIGCWLSSFTLAVTEVTERAELPWLTLSYSDLITGRGFKYIFQSSPTADAQST